MSRNNDEWTRHTRQMRRLLIMIVLLLRLLASAIARRIIEGRRTEPPRLKSSSVEELAPEEARPRGLIAARRRAGTKPAQHRDSGHARSSMLLCFAPTILARFASSQLPPLLSTTRPDNNLELALCQKGGLRSAMSRDMPLIAVVTLPFVGSRLAALFRTNTRNAC